MTATAQTVLPEFIDVLADALPADFQVRFAAQFGVYEDNQALLITGIHFTEDQYAELGPRYQHEEHYNLQCKLISAAGNDDHDSRFQEVYGFYATIQETLANNPSLNQTCRLAWARQLDYSALSDPTKGWSIGELSFEVQIQARANSLN